MSDRAWIGRWLSPRPSSIAGNRAEATTAPPSPDARAERAAAQSEDERRPLEYLLLAACLAANVWLLASAIHMNRDYQDSWILADLVPQFTAVILLYVGYAISSTSLSSLALLTALSSFVLSAAPALKYLVPYGTSVDSAAHGLMLQALVTTHRPDPSSPYVNTPGFHALAAALALASGTDVDWWGRLLPAFLVATVPLGAFVVCRQYEVAFPTAKLAVALSAVSLPSILPITGTAFMIPIFVGIVVLFLQRDAGPGQNLGGYGIRILLICLMAVPVYWHPSTALIAPAILLLAGGLARLPLPGGVVLPSTRDLIRLSVLLLVGALAYYVNAANYVWDRFAGQIRLALSPGETPALIPQKFFEISLQDRVVILLLTQGRDVLLVLLAVGGLILAWRRQDTTAALVRTIGTLWIAGVLVVAGVFLTHFGSQGYQRFLAFPVSLSFLPAGYFLWRTGAEARHRLPAMGAVSFIALCAISLVAVLQLFPYQPLIPRAAIANSDPATCPIVWYHNVNSGFQLNMIRFVNRRWFSGRHPVYLRKDILVDYVTATQLTRLYGIVGRYHVRYISALRHRPTYVLLHRPGPAGPFIEQANYRCSGPISSLRNSPHVDTVYDNGGSFILYAPNTSDIASVRRWG